MSQKQDMGHPQLIFFLVEREGEVFGTGAGFGGLLEGGVATVERVFGLFPVEDLLDGENLDARG